MSNVIAVSTPPEVIVVDSAMVVAINGVTVPPRLTFFVNWLEKDCSSCVWLGYSHADAIAEAADWGLPLIDKTRGRA